MKKITVIIGLLVIAACSSTKFVDSWRNQEITTFNPKKLLVIGMTENFTARTIFEEDLKNAFVIRNINAVESRGVFDESFTNTKKSVEEIDEMILKIAKDGFDAVIITSVKGVDEKKDYTDGYYSSGYQWTRFGRYYFRFQDIYYTPYYYNAYKVYHVETSIYNLNEEDVKSLVWVGSYKLVDPQTISTTVKDYVSKIIKQLESEKLIESYN